MKHGINLLFADGRTEFREIGWALETIRRSGSLEECFLERVGADPEATRKLNWLEEAAP